MTTVYFVRHAQPVHSHRDDRTRPLTEEGRADTALVTRTLAGIPVDAFLSSPYQRTMDTIRPAAEQRGMPIRTDVRLRERESGEGGNGKEMFRRRWADRDYHEPGGESIAMVQSRNVEAVQEILTEFRDKTLVIGTHGTALSTILNHYDPTFDCDTFLKIIDWMPWVVALEFEDQTLKAVRDIAHIYKEFRG